MYYNISKKEYTKHRPSGTKSIDWIEVYADTGHALVLEDLKEFPNLYKSFKNVSSRFWERIYEIAYRYSNSFDVFRTNFPKDLDFPIFGVYIKTYSEFLEFLELVPNTRWTIDSYDEDFTSKYMGYDRTLVWDYFSDEGSANNYFFNNVYTLEEYKNQFLNQKQSTDGTDFKVKRPIAKISRGAEIRGNSVQGRVFRTTITSRPVSYQKVVIR